MEEMIPFLRMIAENPDDDAPRLVFADWLDEHDMPERAEFIRLQIELARMDPSDEGYPEKTARMRRCGIFTEKGKYPFFDHLPTKTAKIGFRRGFIESIHDTSKKFDTSGFDLLPIQTLYTHGDGLAQFKQFTNLKRLRYLDYSGAKPQTILKAIGKEGWFKEVEELVIAEVKAKELRSGLIQKFDLPNLREFYIRTEAFYGLGAPVDEPARTDEDDDEYYDRPRAWAGMAEYLPKNAIPNSTALERFIWYSQDDCDFFGSDEDWYWRGPTMETLLKNLNTGDLKQVELSAYYDDHEGGSEGRIAAPYEKCPLKRKSSLERITLNGDFEILNKAPEGKLKHLRIYGEGVNDDKMFEALASPACNGLESLHFQDRYYVGRSAPKKPKKFALPKLMALNLSYLHLGYFQKCQLPNLISLEGVADVDPFLERKWPNLQHLEITCEVADLKKLAASDCCPNLTTLKLGNYYPLAISEVPFFANCPHMPLLSLIITGEEDRRLFFIVDKGKIIPCRPEIIATNSNIVDEYLGFRF